MKRRVALFSALLLTLTLSAQSMFRINGTALDAVDTCETRYVEGIYSQEYRHAKWGFQAVVRVKQVTLPTTGKTLWRFLVSGFSDAVRLEVVGKGSATFDEECYVSRDAGVVELLDARNGSDAFDEAETAMHQMATRYVFNTPDEGVNLLGSALSVGADDDLVAEARSVLNNVFGLTETSANEDNGSSESPSRECVITPDFPETWETASVRTPYIYYTYRRSGDKAIFDVTQLTTPSRSLVIRQPLGLGKFIESTGTADAHQLLVISIPQRYPQVRVTATYP